MKGTSVGSPRDRVRRMAVWEEGAAPVNAQVLRRPWLLHRPGQGWELLYSALIEGIWQIRRATTLAEEPRGFRPLGPPLTPGPEGSGEDGGVRNPSALASDDGGLLVVYAGFSRRDPDRPSLFSARVVPAEAVCAAGSPFAPVRDASLQPEAASALGLTWQRLGPLLPAGRSGDADAGGCDHPALVRIGRRYWLWYTADDGLGRGCRIAAASSSTGSPWRRHGVVLGRGAPGQPDESGAEAPAALTSGGRIEMVYTGWRPGGARLLRARSSDGLSFDRLGPLAASGPREGSLAIGPGGFCWLCAVVGSDLAIAPVDL